MTKKEAIEQFHRDAISVAADKLFLTKGIEKTTMDEIAKAAEYSKATLYVYFKSKEELFNYIALKGMRTLHARFSQVLSSENNTIEQFMSLCEMLVEYYDEHPLYFESMLGTIAFDPESRKQSDILEEIYQYGEMINDDIDILIQKGARENVFKEDLPSPATGLAGWAFISGLVSLAGNKQEYIAQRIGITKNEFLNFGFQMVLQTLLK